MPNSLESSTRVRLMRNDGLSLIDCFTPMSFNVRNLSEVTKCGSNAYVGKNIFPHGSKGNCVVTLQTGFRLPSLEDSVWFGLSVTRRSEFEGFLKFRQIFQLASSDLASVGKGCGNF